MRIFLSLASPDRPKAVEVALALRGDGHTVFLDEQDLPPADSYHERIRDAIRQADLLIFFISPDSVSPKRYTLSELKFAQNKWPHPKNRVLPVMVAPTPMGIIPAYLRAVSICMPQGNLAAEVAYEVSRMARTRQRDGAGERSGFMSRLLGAEKGQSSQRGSLDALPPLWPAVVLFGAIGFLSGFANYFLVKSWDTNVMSFILTLSRGTVFAVLVCFTLLYFDLGRSRTLLIGAASTLAGFIVADGLLPLLTGAQEDVAYMYILTGAIRAGILAFGLAILLPELREHKLWVIAATAGAAGDLAWGRFSELGLPQSVAFVMWETLVAAAVCYMIGSVAYKRRGHAHESASVASNNAAPAGRGGPVPREPRRK